MNLPEGLYDLLLTERLSQALDAGAMQLRAPGEDAKEYLARALAQQLAALLEEVAGNGKDAQQRQLALINGLLVHLRGQLLERGDADGSSATRAHDLIDLVQEPMRVLQALRHDRQFPRAPELGLATPWLFTAGKGSPSLLHELRRELASADRIDILVSFITVSGVRRLEDVLHGITARSGDGATGSGPKLRILTTTYTGATELRALETLARLPGTEVRVSLDGRRTRLHAKAWLFERQTGFGAAYIGSANLSGAALTGGLEWTVKVTQHLQPALFTRARAHFETLWADPEFERFDPDVPAHVAALTAALRRESGSQDNTSVSPVFFDLQPRHFQQEMLDALALERGKGRRRNLLVAATGTGKTVVAAFDYRNSCTREGGRPRLLFVAHRKEILTQALATYRAVLRDPDFGDYLADGHEPQGHDHLFATIASLGMRGLVSRLGARYWHSVVIDECHHLAAAQFEALASVIQPQLLLGLTATPERADGQSILGHFDMRPDGSAAVELRLWHALDLQLLAPFEYYACDDPTDLSGVHWDRAEERGEIDRIVTGNEVRARLVLREWQRLAGNPRNCRALVFCVSVAHAQFMADFLNHAGLPAACVVGATAKEERARAPARLASGELCALVTADLYNEGVDMPQVDTLLLLRPTQSPVVFQQQIGRGLRIAPGKESCLVLDFVGQHRADFRFDRLLSSITGLTRRELLDSVENGFGSLPSGCHLQLQKQSREQVLKGLRSLVNQNWRRMRTELAAYAALKGRADVRMLDFLTDQGLELDDIYRPGAGGHSGWTNLKRAAGLLQGIGSDAEAALSRRVGSLLHVDDGRRLQLMAALPRELQAREEPPVQAPDNCLRQMLAYQIEGGSRGPEPQTTFIARLLQEPAVVQELAELGALLELRSALPWVPVPALEDTPLCLHASYGIREVLTAVGWLNAERRIPFQAGTLPLAARSTELLFVTLDKREGYHDSIAYHDYAISADEFHWQSQNSAGPYTVAGRRYLESATNGWCFQMFVRAQKKDPYTACGPVSLLEAEGSKPMSIRWKLAVPLPSRLFRRFSALRGV